MSSLKRRDSTYSSSNCQKLIQDLEHYKSSIDIGQMNTENELLKRKQFCPEGFLLVFN